MRLQYKQPPNQKAVLNELMRLAWRNVANPRVQLAAKQAIAECNSRDDMCELEAIYTAVKHGNQNVKGLENGLKYVADPRRVDLFIAPNKLLEMCEQGACGGDCDDHACLIASLCAAIGFKAGLRAWGPGSSQRGELTHVYAVVGYPKRDPQEVIGMDTTVDHASVGWEPDEGHVVTAWVEDD